MVQISVLNAEPDLRENLILDALPAGERQRLQPFLEPVALEAGGSLIEPDQAIRYIYFPINLVTSTLQDLRNGDTVETGLMGMEGVVGIQFWLQQETTTSRTIVQIAGSALRMKVPDFKREVMQTASPLNPAYCFLRSRISDHDQPDCRLQSAS